MVFNATFNNISVISWQLQMTMIIYYYYIKKITISVKDIYLYYRYGGYLVKIDGYNTNKGLGQLISNHNLSHVWIGKDSCQKTFPYYTYISLFS